MPIFNTLERLNIRRGGRYCEGKNQKECLKEAKTDQFLKEDED
jgi:hypothetical protein